MKEAMVAAEGFEEYSRRNGAERGHFLRVVAAEMEAATAALVERAMAETSLTRARLEGEAARTTNQLRMFAGLVEEGSWVDARIDRGKPGKPWVRSWLRPVGPVAVFGASNFPLAFSVAGGDTASALAGGNTVIVKAHPAHPGTSEIAAEAIGRAARGCGMPAGTFGIVYDSGIELGLALVRHAAVAAVGFTGSLRAGRALMDAAAGREKPIPVFAEMGSSNPVFVLPGALRERGGEIAAGLKGSVTLGAGQFCTKPGIVFVSDGGEFGRALGEQLGTAGPFTMLTPGIAAAHVAGVKKRGATLERLTPEGGAAHLFATDVAGYLGNRELEEELFGPSALVVHYGDGGELLKLARSLGGHLTATVHGTDDDLRENLELLRVLEGRVGRVVINGYPTGVEVGPAMVHGGPYPAAWGGESSVGTRAIQRFVRPVCYQDAPEAVLPAELHDGNPLGIWRKLDGKVTRDPVRRTRRSRVRVISN